MYNNYKYLFLRVEKKKTCMRITFSFVIIGDFMLNLIFYITKLIFENFHYRHQSSMKSFKRWIPLICCHDPNSGNCDQRDHPYYFIANKIMDQNTHIYTYNHPYYFITQKILYNDHPIIIIIHIQDHDHWHAQKISSKLKQKY